MIITFSGNAQPDRNSVNRRKDQPLNAHGRYQTVCQKPKKNWKP